MTQWNIVDLCFALVLSLSVAVGVVRGLFKELLSLVAWIVSFWMAFHYGAAAGERWGQSLGSHTMLKHSVGTAGVFVLCLISLSLLARLINHLVERTPLSTLNRFLGLFFGGLRGTVIVVVLIWTARHFPVITQHDDWQDSTLRQYGEQGTALIQGLVDPDDEYPV